MSGPGRIQLHDPKSREHEYPRKRLLSVSKTNVRHAMNAPNVDQFYLSGCVGFSATNMLNCAAAVRSRRRFNEVFHRARSARYLDNNDGIENYSGATEDDPFDWTYPPTDEGSSALGMMKHWSKYGIIGGYDWTFTFDAFLAALQHQPVLVGTEWFENMTNAGDLAILTPGGKSQGGHEYLATSITWSNKLIGFQNSWGENWGFKGGFFMRFDAFEPLLANGGDVAVPRFL